MTLHNLYIFNGDGNLLFYHEWQRKKHTSMSKEEEAKLLYGMIFSLKSFVNKLSPTDTKDSFVSYKTNKYRLHFYETPSSLKFILNTDNEIGQNEVRELLSGIYSQVYVEYAVKSPMVNPGEYINSNLFKNKLEEYVRNSHLFK